MNRSGPYIDVVVDEHEELPEGCELRFHAVGPSRPIGRIRYEPMTGPDGDFAVHAAGGAPALATPVDDSSAGTSVLITGDARGLRLRRLNAQGNPDAEPAIAEPYLLLSPDAILE
ncbi:MAG TPA: hypothetical protein VHM31_16515 [Polyangia bacterium]|nr:hypothetical protein [Polyangia bacterium]